MSTCSEEALARRHVRCIFFASCCACYCCSRRVRTDASTDAHARRRACSPAHLLACSPARLLACSPALAFLHFLFAAAPVTAAAMSSQDDGAGVGIGTGKSGGGRCKHCGRACGNGGSLSRHQAVCKQITKSANAPAAADDDDEQEAEDANDKSDSRLKVGDMIILRDPLTQEQEQDVSNLVAEFESMLNHRILYHEKSVPMKHSPLHILVTANYDAGESNSCGSKVVVVDTSTPKKRQIVLTDPAPDDVGAHIEYFLYKHNAWQAASTSFKITGIDSDGVGFSDAYPDLSFISNERGIVWCRVDDDYDAVDSDQEEGDDSDDDSDDDDDDEDDDEDDDDDDDDDDDETVTWPVRGDIVYVPMKVTKLNQKSFCATSSSNVTVRVNIDSNWKFRETDAVSAAADCISDKIRRAQSIIDSLESDNKKKRAEAFSKKRKQLEGDIDLADPTVTFQAKAAQAWEAARDFALETFPVSQEAAEIREQMNLLASCHSETEEQAQKLDELLNKVDPIPVATPIQDQRGSNDSKRQRTLAT